MHSTVPPGGAGSQAFGWRRLHCWTQAPLRPGTRRLCTVEVHTLPSMHCWLLEQGAQAPGGSAGSPPVPVPAVPIPPVPTPPAPMPPVPMPPTPAMPEPPAPPLPVTSMHAFATHCCPTPQSAAARQSTQRVDATSHRRGAQSPSDEHAAVDPAEPPVVADTAPVPPAAVPPEPEGAPAVPADEAPPALAGPLSPVLSALPHPIAKRVTRTAVTLRATGIGAFLTRARR